ncbi:zinc uptake transcriptional repressor Zur [soil metagenome]
MNCQHRLTNEEAFSRLQSALKDQGARLTSPRKMILEAALKSKKPFSAEALFQALKEQADLATIYRNLTFFNEIGLVSRVDVGSETAVYEIASKDEGHHHHYFVCKTCGKTEALESCSMVAVENSLKKKGYRNLSHRLEFTGFCANC